MPRPRFSHRILAQPPHSIYTRFITPTMHPHSSLAWAIHCLCCPDHCRPPSSSQRCPSRPCIASAVPCESMPCPCLTKQCQASAQPCRSPRHNALTSPCSSLLSPGRAGLCRASSCPCLTHQCCAYTKRSVSVLCRDRSHRRRPDQVCAVSVLYRDSAVQCAIITNHNNALPLQTHSHHGRCTATPIHTLRLLLHSVRCPGNATDISATHCPG